MFHLLVTANNEVSLNDISSPFWSFELVVEWAQQRLAPGVTVEVVDPADGSIVFEETMH